MRERTKEKGGPRAALLVQSDEEKYYFRLHFCVISAVSVEPSS